VQSAKLHITDFLKRSRDQLILDVRSPAEFAQAHIPGAVSLPLFSNEERKIVGTAYKQESREKAIKLGLDFFGPKMRGMVETVESLISERQLAKNGEPDIFVYCWRGGMRSGAISWLLSLYGFRVNTLSGGYKSFRRMVLDTFEQPFKLKILGGYTGSGKTTLLRDMALNGGNVIDLEGLARHKGSAFGNLGLPPQPSQESFENQLAWELWLKTGVNSPWTSEQQEVWLEDESQRIGDINLPMSFWNAMRCSELFFLEIPFEERLDNIVLEYGVADRQKLIDATVRISKRLGGLEARNVLQNLRQGNIREAFRILLTYYDKRYLMGLHNRSNLPTLLHKISCKSVGSENLQLLVPQHQPL
jgi:tRNA 2-selenouridine synthase